MRWRFAKAVVEDIAEIGDLIVELRSATQGLGSYEAAFDHMAEVTGRLADEIAHKARSAA